MSCIPVPTTTKNRSIRLTLSYDGTDFSGWQRQDDARSVQAEVEAALARMHGHPVALAGAGRTDAGVHATGQVASFASDIASIEASKFVPALNALLPRDVRVTASADAPPGFHARFDAKARRYRYYIIAGRQAFAHEIRYAWQIWKRPAMMALDRMASALLGERDFTTFASAGAGSEQGGTGKKASMTRFVHSASWRYEGDYLVFDIEANAFLWKMVRSLVGSMLHFDAKGLGPEAFIDALESRDRGMAGPTAPPQGLFLTGVRYDD
jgi:tRNA pseudouridine38-40 synthase